jgi:hypothetical protein
MSQGVTDAAPRAATLPPRVNALLIDFEGWVVGSALLHREEMEVAA